MLSAAPRPALRDFPAVTDGDLELRAQTSSFSLSCLGQIHHHSNREEMGQRTSVHPSTRHLPRAGTQVPGPWHSGTHDRCRWVNVFIEDTGTQSGRHGPQHPPSILLGSQHQSLPEKGQGPGASYGQLRSARLCSLRTRSWTGGTWTSSSGGLRGGQSHEAPTEVPVFPSFPDHSTELPLPQEALPPTQSGKAILPTPCCAPIITQVLDHVLQHLVLFLFPGMGTG